MSLSVHTNYASLATQNQLGKTNNMLSTAMQRLGTGMRINSASDDAAGLQIATRLQTQSNGQKVGMRNAQDAISMLQTAEGALSEITSIGQRMKDIATQANNGTNGDAEFDAFKAEYSELSSEIKNILENTQYGEGKKLLGGEKELTADEAAAKAKADAKAVVDKEVQVLTLSAAFDTADKAAKLEEVKTTAAQTKLDNAITAAKADPTKIGDVTTAQTELTTQQGVSDPLRATADTAKEAWDAVVNPEETAAVDAAKTGGGAFDKEISFQIGSSSDETMKLDASAEMSAVTAAQAKLSEVKDEATAKTAMGNVDDLLDAVGALRGKFGASINRLDHTINNLGNMNQNIEISKGRIMDADFAAESASMTKQQLLMQSGMSVLGKSNQVGGMVMGLLR